MQMIGAIYHNNHVFFKVWAPLKKEMRLHIISPNDISYDMKSDRNGYFVLALENAAAEIQYFYQPDRTKDYPDPASRYQPKGVHGPSQVINHSEFVWTDEHWRGIAVDHLLLYEVHIGTFSPEGTLEAVRSKLDDLQSLGITALQLMPVCQFPGRRNWGYDGVYPFAVQNSYGGPDNLKALINNCHQKGIAVFVDVVYNHLGLEGNYFKEYGPYFTDRYKTPWGEAINLDGEWCDGVRDFFLANIVEWFVHYHVDGLRVDAIHAMFDNGSVHFWEIASKHVKELEHQLGRQLHLIAESDYNHPRVVCSGPGGLGFDGQWLDDFHHALYTVVFPEGKKFYQEFGKIEQLAKAYKEGFVHTGEFVEARKKKFGASSASISGSKFIVFGQNHDQIGNKGRGERLSTMIGLEQLKLAAAATILSPYVPMLFMGEEYAEENPFSYFIDHGDPALIEAVKKGRKKEFEAFMTPQEAADPKDIKVFESAILNWQARTKGLHLTVLNWYKDLINLRFSDPVFTNFNKKDIQTSVSGKLLSLDRVDETGKNRTICLFNLSDMPVVYKLPEGSDYWKEILFHADASPRYAQGSSVSLTPWSIWILKAIEDEPSTTLQFM